MKDIKNFINEAASNMCVFDASKFDNEKLGELFIKLGESLHAFNKAKEIVIDQYNESGKSVVDIRIKDKSYNEYFRKILLES